MSEYAAVLPPPQSSISELFLEESSESTTQKLESN